MSTRAVIWATQIRNRSAASREVLLALAEMADEDGTVRNAYKRLADVVGTLTPLQSRKAAEALVLSNLAVQRYDMDTYSWTVTLNVVDV